MTFNIHGGRPAEGPVDLNAVAAVIHRLKPDLVALQEVHCFLPPPYAFQNQPHQLRRLLGMELYFGRALRLGPVAYGNAIVSRAPVERVRTRALATTRQWKGLEPRASMEARVLLNEQQVRFLNTHLGLTPEQRCLQVRQITQLVRSEPGPVIVAGDLNATEDSVELQLLTEAGLSDCAAGGPPTFPAISPRCRIDYLLVSRHFAVERCFTEETEVSDHRPLIADLVLRD